MKKLIQFISLLVIVLTVIPSLSNAQVAVENGEISVQLTDYGRMRIFAPNTDTRHIDRFSPLVSGNENEVFDYLKDPDNVVTPESVSNPSMSDQEIRMTINNAYSNLPPNYEIALNVYGWSSGSHALLKMEVTNKEDASLTGRIGFEILPEIDGSYGNEIIKYIAEEGIINSYKEDGSHVGIKFMNRPVGTLKSFAYFSGYNEADEDLYGWLNYGQIDTLYNPLDSGAVVIAGLDEETFAAGGSSTLYVGIAVADSEENLINSMSDLETKAADIITDVNILENLPHKFALSQNYPNPFNPETKIKFDVAKKSDVKLKVFDVLGREVTTLVDKELRAGSYEIDFKAGNLSSGIYFYTLKADSKNITKKMILSK